MMPDDLRHNVQPHPQTRNGFLVWARDAIEALKDFAALLLWDTKTMIAYPDRRRLSGGTQVNLDRLV
jgi:hypothetical protein